MKPADVIAIIMISTICAVILGVFVKSWVTDTPLSIDRARIMEELFTGMLALVAYRMGARERE